MTEICVDNPCEICKGTEDVQMYVLLGLKILTCKKCRSTFVYALLRKPKGILLGFCTKCGKLGRLFGKLRVCSECQEKRYQELKRGAKI